jgi:TetR/AcrR family transcriptional regulator, fatty acid metabolism regulator protein
MHDFLVPDKVKARLYPVVLDLFSSQDFHKVNIREISRRSGLSTSTLY